MGQITALLNQTSQGNSHVLNDLYALLYAEIKAIAGFQLQQLNTGQTITPTVLAHECYLRLAHAEGIQLTNKKHFLNCLSKTMRLYLIDALRAKSSQKRKGQMADGGITEYVGDQDVSFNLMDLDRVLDQIEAIDEKLAAILQHKLILNLTFAEIAEVMTLSERQVMRLWKQGKALLLSMMQEVAEN
ncbi:ECF-type sigma factor [Marinicella meishanensis]|uniref:ECF-type sigma factor n=1 Tax=Marinicella meishanensis TaxID=2873263 RepID=UPI001CBB2A93|nr:ECF-type sigma factor [Marinicella sp. NBU2979]